MIRLQKTSLAVATTLTLAACASNASFDGLYAGMNIGMSNIGSAQTFDYNRQTIQTLESSALSPSVGVTLGYGTSWHCLYTAFEVAFGYTPARQKTATTFGEINLGTLKIDTTYDVDARLKIGRLHNNGQVMGYVGVGLGYQWSKVRADQLFAGSKTAKTLMLTPMIGLEGQITDSMRAYVETGYALSLSPTRYNDSLTPATGRGVKFRPGNMVIRVGANYAFGENDASKNGPSPDIGGFDGPYIGILGGMTRNNGMQTVTHTAVDQRANISGLSYQTGMVMGINRTVDSLLWGVEAHGAYGFGGQERRVTLPGHAATIYSIRNTWSAGAALRVGHLLFNNETLAYARLGVEGKWFRMKAPGCFTGHKTFHNVFIVPGIGVEQKLTQNISARLEATQGIGTKTKRFARAGNALKVSNHATTVSFGLSYKL